FYLDKARQKGMTPKERMEFQSLIGHTLNQQDVKDLSKIVGFSKSDYDYKMKSSFFSLFGRESRLTHSAGDFQVDFSDHDKEAYELKDNQFFVTKFNSLFREKKDLSAESSGCKAGAVLELGPSEGKDDGFEDGFLSFSCHSFNRLKTLEERRKLLDFLAKRVPFDLQALEQFFAELEKRPVEVSVLYQGELYWPSLSQIIAQRPNENFQFVRDLVDSTASLLEPLGLRRAFETIAKQQFHQFLNYRDPRRRLKSLLTFLFDDFASDSAGAFGIWLQPYFIDALNDKKISLTLDVKFINSTETTTFEISQGSEVDSLSKLYYQWRETQGIKGIIDDL
ncbi:MAG: hypothetical protein AAF202_11505, partial [Pseudomonadota bacterium]